MVKIDSIKYNEQNSIHIRQHIYYKAYNKICRAQSIEQILWIESNPQTSMHILECKYYNRKNTSQRIQWINIMYIIQ